MSSQEIFKKYEQKVGEYQDHIEELKSTKNDYKQLIDTLQHLPDTLQPKIMVPMGKLAFFEGNLKNTNEILILLGDNYFAKRSSKQTIDIIQRRDKDIDTSINDLREQIKALKQRISMTTDLSKALHEKEYDNIVEIKEEYNSDEEREKEKKRKEKPQKSTTTTTTTPSKDKPKTEQDKKKSKEMDEEFDKMLKRLSVLEEKENKMGDDYDEEEFNKKFNKKLDITGSDEEYDDDDDNYNNNNNNNNNNDDDDDEDDDREYYQEEGFEDEKPENSNYNKNIEEDDDDYYDEGEEIVEYYDENGNIVDINDPNVEYIQGDGDDDEDDDDEDDIELNESELEEIKDFHMDKKGQDLSEKEVKELTDFYHSKQKKRISYIDTPQPPTPEATTSITPKSILKTNSSGNLMSTIPKSYNENDENDIRRYIKNLDKQDKFENQKTISVPNPPKDVAFSGDIVEKQTDLFPFDEIPKPTPPSNAKQSRFKSSRQNK
ncbi:hypothetical protein ACTFIZ_003162 [Dictyostelium cf. discoideum]